MKRNGTLGEGGELKRKSCVETSISELIGGSENHLGSCFELFLSKCWEAAGNNECFFLLSFYDCRFSGGDTHTLPAVIETN